MKKQKGRIIQIIEKEEIMTYSSITHHRVEGYDHVVIVEGNYPAEWYKRMIGIRNLLGYNWRTKVLLMKNSSKYKPGDHIEVPVKPYIPKAVEGQYIVRE